MLGTYVVHMLPSVDSCLHWGFPFWLTYFCVSHHTPVIYCWLIDYWMELIFRQCVMARGRQTLGCGGRGGNGVCYNEPWSTRSISYVWIHIHIEIISFVMYVREKKWNRLYSLSLSRLKSLVLCVSTNTREYNGFDTDINLELIRILWESERMLAIQ